MISSSEYDVTWLVAAEQVRHKISIQVSARS